MRKLTTVCAWVFALAVMACASQKDPAQAALTTAQDSFSAVSADAMKYVPDEARAVQSALTAAQDAFNKGDYAAALTQAQALPAQVSSLSTAIAAKKTELTTEWTSASAAVSGMMTALQSRVDTLSKSKGVPAGLTKEKVEDAKTGFAAASQEWADATAAQASGDMQTAVTKANDVKAKLIDLMKSLNMKLPPGVGGL